MIPEKVTAAWAHNDTGMLGGQTAAAGCMGLLPRWCFALTSLAFMEDGQCADMISCLEICSTFMALLPQSKPSNDGGTPDGDQTPELEKQSGCWFLCKVY